MGAARRRHLPPALPPAPSRFFVLFVSQLLHAKAFGEDHEMPTRASKPQILRFRREVCTDATDHSLHGGNDGCRRVAVVGITRQGGDMGHELAAQEMKTTTQQDSCTAPRGGCRAQSPCKPACR